MPTTLRDVAVRANVSVRTVSNVVSGYQHVSADVRERVKAAIDELDYRPNPVARTLRTGRSGALLLVVPEIDSPYFSDLAREVVDQAAEAGYRVVIDQTGHNRTREHQLLTGATRTMLVDGILFAPLVTAEELVEMRARLTTPVVLLGEHAFDGTYDHVSIDNVRAAHDATRHLLETGRQRIAAVGDQPSQDYATPLLRAQGYRAALTEAGLEPDRFTTRPVRQYKRADGYHAAQELLAGNELPDAIFCYTDLLAVGAMKAVFDSGRNVPDDIAVIGIDDIEEGRYTRPTLSTVSLDIPFIARNAIARLTARINEPDLQPSETLAQHRLVVRESSARSTQAG